MSTRFFTRWVRHGWVLARCAKETRGQNPENPGTDYRINGRTATATRTMIQKYAGNGRWGKPLALDMRVEGNQVMTAVPRTALAISGDAVALDFHWMDNAQTGGNNRDYVLQGDNAPERRFNYRFEATDSGAN